MPARFHVGEAITCQRNKNALGKTFPGKILQVTKHQRSAGNNWHSEKTICFYCLLDFLTCYRCQPDSIWRYVVQYDSDGYEETQVTAERLFKTNPIR